MPVRSQSVTVQDANSCAATKDVGMGQPGQLTASASGTDALCFGGTGTITASAVGGSGAYQFKLDGGAFQAGGNFSGVTVRSPYATLFRSNSCTATKDVAMGQPG